jgi:hypothetical protein
MDWEPSFAPAVPPAPAFVPPAPVSAPAAAPATWASVRTIISNHTVFCVDERC